MLHLRFFSRLPKNTRRIQFGLFVNRFFTTLCYDGLSQILR